MNDPFGRPQASTDSSTAAAGDGPSDDASGNGALGRLGVLVVVLGGIVALVGFFLPLVASPDGRVEIHDNYAFWYDPGGFAIGLALGAPVMAVLRWRGLPLPWWIPTGFGAIGILGTALVVLLISALSLYDLTWSGPATPETDALDPGLGPLVIALGYLATTIGGVLMRALPPLPAKAAASVAALPTEGWYPDPESDDERWWDGRRWGDARRPAPGAAPAHAWEPPAPPRTLWSRGED